MTPLTLAIFIWICDIIIATASDVQTFKNVKNGTITCGKDKDCVIICDETKGCKDSTFNLLYGNIKILCSGDHSCCNTKISSRHTLSLNMTFSGDSAFTNGHYWAYDDENITVHCNGDRSCSGARFHYLSDIRTTHRCDNTYACSDATLHILTETDIMCGDYDCSCFKMSVISATDNYTVKVTGSQYTFPDEPIYIFPTSADNIHNIIICDECKLDSILFVAAMSLNESQGCFASNKSCIATMINLLHANPFTTVDNYYGSITYPDSTGDILLIFSQRPGEKSSEVTTPEMNSNENAVFEVFCIECAEVIFNFTETQSVIMRSFWKTSDQWLRSSVIYGPQHSFTFVADLSFNLNKNNRVYVNNTAVVNIKDIGYMSSVYLGAATNVNILCWGYYGCSHVNVSSTLNPVEMPLFGPSGEWKVKCESKESCEPGFNFYFTYLNKLCPFTASGADVKECPFLKPLVINTTNVERQNTTEAHRGAKHAHFEIPTFIWIILAIVVVLSALIVSGLLVWTKRKKRMQSEQQYAQLNDDHDNKL